MSPREPEEPATTAADPRAATGAAAESGTVKRAAAEPAADEASPSPSGAGPSRQTLDEIFGDVLPDTTRDEHGSATGDPGRDSELLRDVPPHHG